LPTVPGTIRKVAASATEGFERLEAQVNWKQPLLVLLTGVWLRMEFTQCERKQGNRGEGRKYQKETEKDQWGSMKEKEGTREMMKVTQRNKHFVLRNCYLG
jgi:hypothetical protein